MRLTWVGVMVAGVFAGAVGGCSGAAAGGFDWSPSDGEGGAGGGGGEPPGGSSGSGFATGAGGGVTGGGAGTGGAPTSSGKPCGGPGEELCGPMEWCDYGADLCGGDGQIGACVPRPTACPEFYSPTCACDGQVYGNPCEAASAGVDLANEGGCKPPDGLFPCGHRFCDVKSSYCVRTGSDVGGMPDSYDCAPLPTLCQAKPSCGCIVNPCGGPVPSKCAMTPEGGIFVMCPGG
jgi:hypothetical protein